MTKTELLKIAEAEIGYIGKASRNEDDTIKEAPNGEGKYCKYSRELYNAGYFNGNKNGYDWCCVFAYWCFWEASGRDKSTAGKYLPYSDLGAGVRWVKKALASSGTCNQTSVPTPGSIVIFKDLDGELCHVGFVRNLYSNSFDTVEGNVSNRVVSKTYSNTYGYIDSIWEIPYDEEPVTDEECDSCFDVSDIVNSLDEWETVWTDGTYRVQKIKS